MKLTQEQRKQHGINFLKKLSIYNPYIKAFEKDNTVTYFENFGGYYANQDAQLYAKYKELEEKYNFTVYAIVHSYIEDMECWSMLIVPDDDEDIEDLCDKGSSNYFYVFTYTWNVTEPDFSEFGDITVQSAFGGIRRIY